MVSAPIPKNETARLRDLQNSGLLDTAHEDEFDEIVRFASTLCNMPISLISLVDSNRQWFKAKVGVDIDETNRDVSFCAHAILQDQLFEVEDTLTDNRFADNPFVVNDPSIRFYAGMPLISSAGNRLGTLCVLGPNPGHLNEMQRFGLRVLAHNVIKIAELRVKNKELYYLNETQKKTISILAHDVRNPLSSIKNIIDLKRSEILDTGEAMQMMDMVTGQLNNTIEMVENVVNWGQVQQQLGTLQLADFDLYKLVKRVFGTESIKSLTKNNKLVNEVPRGTIAYSDERAVEFILRNLISNANKYTENGRIFVSMEHDGLKTIIWVTDTGVGMTAERAKELLTKKDFQSTDGTSNEKGSGLGLTLVKEFIDRLDGSITVESTINKGTSFKIII